MGQAVGPSCRHLADGPIVGIVPPRGDRTAHQLVGVVHHQPRRVVPEAQPVVDVAAVPGGVEGDVGDAEQRRLVGEAGVVGDHQGGPGQRPVGVRFAFDAEVLPPAAGLGVAGMPVPERDPAAVADPLHDLVEVLQVVGVGGAGFGGDQDGVPVEREHDGAARLGVQLVDGRAADHDRRPVPQVSDVTVRADVADDVRGVDPTGVVAPDLRPQIGIGLSGAVFDIDHPATSRRHDVPETADEDNVVGVEVADTSPRVMADPSPQVRRERLEHRADMPPEVRTGADGVDLHGRRMAKAS